MGSSIATRKLRLAQSATTGMQQVIGDLEFRNDPVFQQVIADVRALDTSVASMLALGLARFIGADEQEVEAPVTMRNYRHRIGAPLPWSKTSYKDYSHALALFERKTLTPQEFAKARDLIEKLERMQRQSSFDFDLWTIDPLQEHVAF